MNHASAAPVYGLLLPDAIWVKDLGGHKEPFSRWGPDPWEGAILREKGHLILKYIGYSVVPCAKTAEPIEIRLN